LRACWQQAGGATRCDSFSLGKALNYALTHDAQVINMSLSGPPDRLLRELIDAACARGIKVVAAVDPDASDGGFPASHPGVFAVAATPSARLGAQVLVAPGRDVPTTAPGARWRMVSGSSYSAAHISGMMALLSELRPGLALARIREDVVAGAPHGTGGTDFCATLARVAGRCTCVCASGSGEAPRLVRGQ
jgi:subtilisin family serine protease